MKRFIVNILVFFLIVAAIDFAVGKLGDYLQTHAKGGAIRTFNDLLMKDQHDVLFFGSSRAHRHYDAPFLSDALGLDVYNAGYDGNGVILAYGMMELIFDRYQPKLVLYDVEPAFDINVYKYDNEHKRYIAKLKPYFQRQTISRIIADVSKEEWIKVHFGLLRYNSSSFNLIANYFWSTYKYNSGFDPTYGELSTEIDSTIFKPKEIDFFKLKYFEKILYLARSKKVKFAIVASPKYGSLTSDALQPIKDICSKYQVPFIDYYADTFFMSHKKLFKEPMHLNVNGARSYSTRLVPDIKNLLE